MVKRRYILLISLLVHGLGLFALPNMLCSNNNKTHNISMVFTEKKLKTQQKQVLQIPTKSSKIISKSEKAISNQNVFNENAQQNFNESPILIHSVTPTYPESARKKGIEATFNAKITIDNYGNVVAVSVLENAYSSLFKSAIEQALYSWKFQASSKVRGFIVPIEFKLR